jgi:predicted dienelactone hydrolase
MRAALAVALLALGLAACTEPPGPARPGKVGMTTLQFVDAARQRPLDVQLWYPAAPDATETPQAYERAFRGRAALDGAYLDGGRRALIVLSHGDRGTNVNQSWLGEALAGHGYIVASVAHWLNTRTHNTPEATLRAWDRPQDVSFVIGALLQDATWQPRIDAARIGAAGHSSGGYTALALAGARYWPPQMRDYCRGPQAGPDCGLVRGIDVERFDFTGAAAPYRDARVRAALALAPALGPGMTDESLNAIGVPVAIVATRDDEILPFEQHAARYAREIPGAQLDVLPAGGHFVFMPECNVAGRVFTWFNAFDVCGRRHDVDRGAVHAQIVQRALAFFGTKLGSDSNFQPVDSAARNQASTPE